MLNNNDPDTSSHICPDCSTVISTGLVSCPGCNKLVYAKKLTELVAQVQQADKEKRYVDCITLWREALTLLPKTSKQYKIIFNKIEIISQKIDSGEYKSNPSATKPQKSKSFAGKASGLGALGLLLWKFKFIFTFLLTKGKILLLGLTKASTLFSMFLSFSLYWSIWGWKFALGIIVSIYIHEMGHVVALRKFGIPASAPAFIPGLGAIVRMKQMPISKIENARIGIAGPIWGLAAAVMCFMIYKITDLSSIGAIAKVGAWINLFNLLPFEPLDGGRCFSVLSSKQKWVAVSVIGAMWYLTSEGLLLLILLTAVFSVMTKAKSTYRTNDTRALLEYTALIIILTLMCSIDIPIG